jgi:hypothetical protein
MYKFLGNPRTEVRVQNDDKEENHNVLNVIY